MTATDPRPVAQPILDATLSLPTAAGAPATAREVVAAHTEFLPDGLRQTAILLVSELVTNAVLHGGPHIVLHLVVSSDSVRVEVHDRGDAVILRSGAATSRQAHGRGLAIVQSLATCWGVEATTEPHGKQVWFELDTTAPTTAVTRAC